MSLRPLFVLLIALLGATPKGLHAQDVDSKPVEKFVIALKPDKNPEQMVQERTALADYLRGATGRRVEVIIPLSSAVILEGLANGSVDLGYLSATELVKAREQRAARILLAGEIKGKTSYESYWVTLREKPYAGIEDLRGRPVAFASKTSTSGFVIPLWDLRQRGLVSDRGDPEEFFGRGHVYFGIGYVSAVERVLAGDAEAAAVSDYVLDADKHLTAEQRGRLRKLASQGPVPTHVLAVRASLAAADQAVLRAALLALNEPGREGLRDRLFTSRLVEVDGDEHVAGLVEALRLAARGAGSR